MENANIRFLLLGPTDKNSQARLYIFALGLTFYDRKFYKKGIKVITYPGERLFPQAKSKDLLLSFIALREAQRKDCLDALLLDSKGNIREGTRTNFFAVKDNKIFTPPLTDVLEGITRKLALEAAKRAGIEAAEERISLKKIKNYQEFFITSTSMNIMPINQIDEYIVPGGAGEITKKLIKAFKEYRGENSKPLLRV